MQRSIGVDVLGPMFNEVAQVDWPEHLSKLTAFWCRALFGMADYQGNPFRAMPWPTSGDRFRSRISNDGWPCSVELSSTAGRARPWSRPAN